MTSPWRHLLNRYVVIAAFLALSCNLSTIIISAQNSELLESGEFANSQYDADPDFRSDTQLHFAPPLPTTSSPPSNKQHNPHHNQHQLLPQPNQDDNTLMSSSSGTSMAPSTTYTELSGGSITSDRILRSSESPYSARDHITIEKGAKLIIEPGVRVEFAPTVGITVRGIIHAVVSIQLLCDIIYAFLVPKDTRFEWQNLSFTRVCCNFCCSYHE